MRPKTFPMLLGVFIVVYLVSFILMTLPAPSYAQDPTPTIDCQAPNVFCVVAAPTTIPIEPTPPPPQPEQPAPPQPEQPAPPQPEQPTQPPQTEQPTQPPQPEQPALTPTRIIRDTYACQIRSNGLYTDAIGWYTPPNGQRQLYLADGRFIPENQIAHIDAACTDEEYGFPNVDQDGYIVDFNWFGCSTTNLARNIKAEKLNIGLINAYARHSDLPNRCNAVRAIFDMYQLMTKTQAAMPLIDAEQFPEDCKWAIIEFIEPWKSYGQLRGGNTIAQLVYDAAFARSEPCEFILDIVSHRRLPDGYPPDYVPELLPLICSPSMSNDLYIQMVKRLRTLKLNDTQIEVLRAVGEECLPITYLSRAGAYEGDHLKIENYLVTFCKVEAVTAIEYTMLIVSTGLNPQQVVSLLPPTQLEREECLRLINRIIAELLVQLPPPAPPTPDNPLDACDPTLIYTYQTYVDAQANNPFLARQLQQLQLGESSTPCHAIENFIRTGYAVPEIDNLFALTVNDLTMLRQQIVVLFSNPELPLDSDRMPRPPLQLPEGALSNAAAVFVVQSLPEAPGDIYIVRNGIWEEFIVTPDSDESFPVLSADGRHVAFIERPLDGSASSIVIQEILQRDANGVQRDGKKYYLFTENLALDAQGNPQDRRRIANYPMAFSPDAAFLFFTIVENEGQPGERYTIFSIKDPLLALSDNAQPFVADTHSPSFGAILYPAPELVYLAFTWQLDGSIPEIYLRVYRNDEILAQVTAQGLIAGNINNARLNNTGCLEPAFTVNFISLYFQCSGRGSTQFYVYEVHTDAIYPLNLGAMTAFHLSPGPERGFMVYDDGQTLYFVQRQDSGIVGDDMNAGDTLEINPDGVVALTIPGKYLSYLRWAAPGPQDVPNEVGAP